jgi:hypothetical protein
MNVKKAAAGLEKGSKERNNLDKVIKRIGDEGKGRVSISFGSAGDSDRGPNLGGTLGNRITIDFAAIDSVKAQFAAAGRGLDSAESGALDAGVVAHEGRHLGIGPFLLAVLTGHREHAALFSESITYQGLHNTDKVFRLWNESWLAVGPVEGWVPWPE